MTAPSGKVPLTFELVRWTVGERVDGFVIIERDLRTGGVVEYGPMPAWWVQEVLGELRGVVHEALKRQSPGLYGLDGNAGAAGDADGSEPHDTDTRPDCTSRPGRVR